MSNSQIPIDFSNGLPNVTYGWCGIGVMGFPMAQSLRAHIPKSSKLIICEIVNARREQFLAETEGQVEVADSPKELAEKADIIISTLPKSQHVLDAFLNPSTGFLAAQPITSPSAAITQKFFLESSTIDTATSLQISQKVEASGLGIFTDAPVSGGPNGAKAGTLTFMVGGSPELFEKVRVLVADGGMGREDSIFHCGGPGAGLATKMINNYLSAVCILGVSEAMNMGRLYGLDPNVLAGVINVSSGKCYNSLDQNPVKGVTKTAAATKDFQGGFSTELCKGVVDMAVELGKQVGAKSVLSEVVKDTYAKAVKSEMCSGKDCRSVYRLFSENDGEALD